MRRSMLRSDHDARNEEDVPCETAKCTSIMLILLMRACICMYIAAKYFVACALSYNLDIPKSLPHVFNPTPRHTWICGHTWICEHGRHRGNCETWKLWGAGHDRPSICEYTRHRKVLQDSQAEWGRRRMVCTKLSLYSYQDCNPSDLKRVSCFDERHQVSEAIGRSASWMVQDAHRYGSRVLIESFLKDMRAKWDKSRIGMRAWSCKT